MSITNKIKGMFGGSDTATVTDPAAQVLVVDGTGLADGKKNSAQLTPRDQIDILQALSRINKREKYDVKVVFVGEPLRKVAHGELFDDVQVFFAEDEKGAVAQIIAHVKDLQRKRAVMLVTSNAAIEQKAAGMGVATLRGTTFRKGFDEFGGGNRRNSGGRSNSSRRSGGGGNREGGNREGGNREGGGNRRRSGGNRNQTPRQPKSEAVGGSDVSDLIDLVE